MIPFTGTYMKLAKPLTILAITITLLLVQLPASSYAWQQHYFLPSGLATTTQAHGSVSPDKVYIQEQWSQGRVFLVSGEVLENSMLRFDLNHQQLEIKHGKNISICNARLYTGFEWHDKTTGLSTRYVKRIVPNQKGLRTGHRLFKLVYEGEHIQLLQRMDITRDQKNRRKSPVDEDYLQSLKTQEFYMLTDTGLHGLHHKKRAQSFAHFGPLEEQVRDYVKVNDYRLDREADLLEIIQYYDSRL